MIPFRILVSTPGSWLRLMSSEGVIEFRKSTPIIIRSPFTLRFLTMSCFSPKYSTNEAVIVEYIFRRCVFVSHFFRFAYLRLNNFVTTRHNFNYRELLQNYDVLCEFMVADGMYLYFFSAVSVSTCPNAFLFSSILFCRLSRAALDLRRRASIWS